MRKTVTTMALVLATSISLLSGCQSGKESRYAYRDQGIEQMNSQDYEGAILSFDQALEKSRGLVGGFERDVLRYRAEAEFLLEDYAAAAHTYDILIKLDGEKADPLYLRCMARAESGDNTGALDDYTKAVVLDPKAVGREKALLAVGAAMEEAGNTADAMTLYQQAAADGTANGEIYNRMGMCKMEEQAYDEAITCFSQGVQAGEIIPELYFNQAAAYEYKGDFAKALELMQQYVAQGGTDEAAEREIAFLKTR